MLDTVGAEMQVVNKNETSISLLADSQVILTPDQGQEASSEILPINFDGLAKVHLNFQTSMNLPESCYSYRLPVLSLVQNRLIFCCFRCYICVNLNLNLIHTVYSQ
jgi:hypothetical protein